jgi:hypothetical protein
MEAQMARVVGMHEQFARFGAQARLTQLDQERALILKMFPGLRSSSSAVQMGLHPRRKLSAAARKAMSVGMRRFWARRKAAEKLSRKA